MSYIIWATAAAALTCYLGLFAFRRHVSLRPRRVGWLLCATVAVRLALLPNEPLVSWTETIVTFALLAAGVGMLFIRRTFLLRVDAATLREQIATACRGLFLQCEEQTPGFFQLAAKGTTKMLRVRKVMTKMQWVTLPALYEKSKISLLIQWLSKQYPGPIPRIHIVLKKE